MNIKQTFPWLPFLGAAIIIMLIVRIFGHNHSTELLGSLSTECDVGHNQISSYNTEHAQKRTIISIVKAQGILVSQEIIQVGNLINGIIRYLYVAENELVEKGQLLAEIDDSLEDSDVNKAFGTLDEAQARLKYQLEFLKRQEQLFACKQISLDTYQQAEREYQTAYARVELAKGAYETAKLIYDNKRIHAPASGMIIAKNVTVGQAVSNFSPASVLYAIATHIKELKAHIFLEDGATDILEPHMPTRITLDTYPHKKFTGVIQEITNTPHAMELSDYTFARLVPTTAKPAHHCAIMPIDNSDLSLRPGMTFSAQITVAEKEDTLSVPNQAFKITQQNIQQLAQNLDYHYKPLEGKTLIDALHNDAKMVWVLEDKTFVEKAVITGASDTDYTEIVKGLDGSENIISSVK